MKQLTLFCAFAAALFYLSSCTQTTTHVDVETINMDTVKMQIDNMEKAYADASNRRDVDGVLAYYADDAISYPPNEAPVSGKNAIAARLRNVMQSDTSGNIVTLTSTGVWASGNYATETGTWKDTDKNGNVLGTGNYMTLFELRNGKYAAIRDMWNRDSPAPTVVMKTN